MACGPPFETKARFAFISCTPEHVDNLGAYTASRPETGLLIPSGFYKRRGELPT